MSVQKEKIMNTYKLPQKAGITDLKGYLGDFVTEWWTQKEWEEWDKGKEDRDKWNEEYVKALKEKGEFGKEYNLEIHLQENSLFDNVRVAQPMNSYKMVFIDLSQDNKLNSNEST